MKPNRYLLAIVVCMPLLLSSARPVMADPVTYTVPTQYATIQEAIDTANTLLVSNPTNTNTYSILVMPNTPATAYAGFSLKSKIQVSGQETARTFVTGGGSGVAITATGVSGVLVKNLTILSATTGILVSGNSSVDIKNNVFLVGTGTGVTVQGSPSTTIVNNTFYQNGTAIVRDSDLIRITNNIFSQNGTNINQGSIVSQNNITYNDFNPARAETNIGTGSIPNATVGDPDPLLVNAAQADFHLGANSPCIDTGDPTLSDPYVIPSHSTNPSDMGAYGGPSADTIPFPVSGLSSSTTDTAPYAVTLTWTANTAYTVGGYKVYYGYSSGTYNGSDALDSTGTGTLVSPIDVKDVTTFALNGLNPSAVAPAAPTLNPPSPRDGILELSWSSVTGATGYKVHWGLASTSENTSGQITDTSYTLNNLTNGQTYKVAVSAIAQATYYIAVTAYDNSGLTGQVGVHNESAYSTEATVPIGPVMESGLSNEQSDFPEPVIPYPNLPNKGCFIATAAYGHYSAPQVQALRAFRDRYLLATLPGELFVRWYYRHSPAAADYINAHPALKPYVRAALLPLVGGALFLTQASLAAKWGVVVFFGLFMIVFAKKALAPGRDPLKKFLLLILLICPSVASAAGDPLLDQPHWSLEIKGGTFTPALPNFKQYYGKRSVSEYGGSLAYKVLRQVELGVEANAVQAKGQALAPVHGITTGSVTYEVFPLNVFILLRGVFSENQWVIPYAGGGWTRMFYQETVEDQGTSRGSADGYHGRAGLQFALDGIDADAANSMYLDYGVYHTYLFIEAEQTRAVVKSVSTDLGGTSYMAGLLFEF